MAIQGLGIDYLRPLPVEYSIYPLIILEADHEECDALTWLREQERLTEECIEPLWLSVTSTPDLAWDYQMCTENNNLTLLKELMQKALVVSLSSQEQKILTDIFDSESRYTMNQESSCRSLFAPSQLPELVEKNPMLASHLLIKLSPSNQIGHYYEKLIKCELTLSSLEVVNRLANAVELPKEFLTFFVSNCIQQCDKKDKNQQNRLVRLVCVFIKTMIKSKIIQPQDMFIELQAFCIEFNKISEASNLFKQLKGTPNTNPNQSNQ